jgi:ribonuclease BN (tRNA processing enzyme)
MNLTFLGVGSALSADGGYHSNMLIESGNGAALLLDCGGDIRFSLAEAGISPDAMGRRIQAIYISHLHADHVGGLEWLAFATYFDPGCPRPELLAVEEVLEPLWAETLRGGLGLINGRRMALSDYFKVRSLSEDATLRWDGLRLTPVRMPHVRGDGRRHDSFGLFLREGAGPAVFISTDARLDRQRLAAAHRKAAVIFHDCETGPIPSGVHAHYDELRTLPAGLKAKMWLYHYGVLPETDAKADGFAGFVRQGQRFRF